MTERRPASIAQPGMTARGGSTERELEAYQRETALHAPDDFVDRVMAAIDPDPPARSPLRWLALSMFGGGRLRTASVLLVAMLALTGGAALAAAGASAIIGQDRVRPTFEPADELPVAIPAPTATPTERVDDASAEPREVEERTETTAPDVDAATDEPESGDDATETDGPEAGDDATETDEPEAPDDADEPEAADDQDGGDDGQTEPDETPPDDDESRGDSSPDAQ